MVLYSIDKKMTALQREDPKTFLELGLTERKLQELLSADLSILGDNLYLISEELNQWDDSSRRIDILALDSDSNLVVIELKRDEGTHMDLQSIRCAAMISPMTFKDVIEAKFRYLSRKGISSSLEQIRQEIIDFLGDNFETSESNAELDGDEISISPSPRIILLSKNFSTEITTTVLWLNDQGLGITCMEYKPYRLDENLYLDLNQVIPVPSAERYMVQMRKKSSDAQRQSVEARKPKTIPQLVEKGLLLPGARVKLIKALEPGLKIPAEGSFAVFKGGQQFEWTMNNKIYSLSALCYEVCHHYGGKNTNFQGPYYWGREEDEITLVELLRENLS